MANVYAEMMRARELAKSGKYAPPPREVAPRSRPNPYTEMMKEKAEREATTPIAKAFAQREEDVLQYQAQRQADYAKNREQMLRTEAEHPEFFGPTSMREEPPLLDPYLEHREPPIAPREEAPKQELGSGFSAQMKLDLLHDPETKRRVLAKTLFPNDPDAMARVGFDRDGQPVYVGDDGKLHKIASGTARFGANLIANSPELTLGAFTAPMGPGAAATSAGAAHILKRRIASAVFNEPYDPASLLKSTAAEVGATYTGELLGKGLNLAGNRGRTIDFTPPDMAAAEARAADVFKKTGVRLSLPAASGDRRLIGMYSYLARYPGEAAKVIQDSYHLSQGEFHEASRRMLDTIASTPVPAETAGLEGISTAKLAMRAATDHAQNRVRPIYERAYAEVPYVVDRRVLSFFRFPQFRQAMKDGQRIAELEEKEAPFLTVLTMRPRPQARTGPRGGAPTPQAGGPGMTVTPVEPEQKLLGADRPALGFEGKEPGTDLVPVENPRYTLPEDRERVPIPGMRPQYRRERVGKAGWRFVPVDIDAYTIQVPDLRALDYTKRALDDRVNQLYAAGDKHEAKALARQRDLFVDELDRLSKTYGRAREAWTNELTNTIRPLERGLVGVLSRLDDPHAAQAAARIFSGTNVTETMIRDAKATIQKQNPDVWDDLTRTWVAEEWDKAQKVSRTSTEVNAPGAFHQALFETPDQRARTMAMLGKDAADSLEAVMEAAEALKQTPISGSNTPRDLRMENMLKGFTSAGYAIWQAVTSPRETIRKYAERTALDQNALAVAQGLTDPASRHKLRVILRMKPSTQRNVLLFNVIGAQVAKDYVQTQMDQGPNTKLLEGDPNAVGE